MNRKVIANFGWKDARAGELLVFQPGKDGGSVVVEFVSGRGSGYLSALPISSLAWREKHGTEAGFGVAGNVLTVYDDYGAPSEIRAEDPEFLQYMVLKLERAGIPRKEVPHG